jgi:hypothetical protein
MIFRSIGDTAFCSRFLYEPAGARLYVLRKAGGEGPQSDAEASDLLTGAIVPPPALVRAGLEALPAITRVEVSAPVAVLSKFSPPASATPHGKTIQAPARTS